MHVLQLPITVAKKQRLLLRLGVQCDPNGVDIEADVEHMDQLLLAARVHCLSKVPALACGLQGLCGRGAHSAVFEGINSLKCNSFGEMS